MNRFVLAGILISLSGSVQCIIGAITKENGHMNGGTAGLIVGFIVSFLTWEDREDK